MKLWSRQLAPDILAEQTAGQQSERAGDDASIDVQAEHGEFVGSDVAFGERAKSPKHTAQCDGDQQMNPRKMQPKSEVGFDEDRRDGRDEHRRDPSVAKDAVEFGALFARQARP